MAAQVVPGVVSMVAPVQAQSPSAVKAQQGEKQEGSSPAASQPSSPPTEVAHPTPPPAESAPAAANGGDTTPTQTSRHGAEAGGEEREAVREAWAPFEPFRTPVVMKKFKRLFASWGAPGGTLDVEALKGIGWTGVPHEYRPDTWQVLLGYIPPAWDRAVTTRSRKREEYWACVQQYYAGGARGQGYAGRSEVEQRLLRDILVDLPRTMPTVPLAQTPFVQRALERLLYLWAVRHPASSYVQGINDLAATIIIAFLAPLGGPDTGDLGGVDPDTLHDVEADVYWCLTRVVDRIADNYTPTQPGIQRQVWAVRELVARMDAPLVAHLEEGEQPFDFPKFAFRWMNCLMTREVPLPLILRLWDSYAAEERGFEEFHTYVCAAMLLSWSDTIRGMEFQDFVMFLQSPPSLKWDVRTLQGVISQAWVLKSTFSQAQGHLGRASASPGQ